ncbi:hypothetical protein [Spirosoma sp. KNUC1025]|uniref:hypothetical protein n=1 Tax=Spirosoma sp. KNUC1025 TaxID=2894082 RepID=UPI003864E098|nr:hypothetical protein LN737_03860 [Spirosoma sp. KNUC1025]
MKKQLLFCAFVGLMTSCQQDDAIQPNPSTLAAEVVGTYRTNVYLDPSYVAVPSNLLPYAELKTESDSGVALIYTNPEKSDQVIQHITLSRQANSIQLHAGGSVVGTLQTDRIFTNSGMEKQGKLLRLSVQNTPERTLSFVGYR